MPKILVVDDEQDIFEMYRVMLAPSGYEVITATRGDEAVDICRKEESIDMVISWMLNCPECPD
ncbi:hypothetical protein JXB41_01255 [Candidatus Woesearchaeota archaeon]|nr:hypothetical protein [Candidatus Woesearchaeota archaeon]